MAKPDAPKILSPAPIPVSNRNTTGALPKINRNDVMRAVQATFVRPAIQKVTSGFQQMNPVNIARSWANANPVTSKVIDFKANLDDNRQERDRPERERRAAFGSAGDNRSWREMREGGGSGEGGGMDAMMAQTMINTLEKILDATTSGFAGMTTELRSLRMSTVTTVRNTNLLLQEQKRGTSAILEMVEAMKGFTNTSKPTIEDKIEARKAVATESEVGEKKSNPLLELLKAAGTIALQFIGQMRAGATALLATVRGAMAGLGARIATLFRGLRLPRALETLGATFGRFLAPLTRVGRMLAPVGAFVTRVGELLAPMLKMFAPVLSMVGRLGGFLKMIPVVGQVLMGIMIAFDGIKGFVKGFSATDGNILEKLWGGFKGAIVGIVKGLLSPFIWLGKLIWKGIKGLADMLGLDKLAESLGKIDFGELFKKVVKLFVPGGNMWLELWDLVKELVSGVWKKITGNNSTGEGGVDANGNPVNSTGNAPPGSAGNGAPLTPSADATRPVNMDAARTNVASTLSGAGMSKNVVAGFLGNFEVEGGYNGARGDRGTAAGIAQWRGPRQANFRRIIGKDVTQATHAEQARFVAWEMQNPGQAGMTVAQRDQILAAKSPAEAARLIDRFYERSNGVHRNQRAQHADRFAATNLQATPRPQQVAPAPRTQQQERNLSAAERQQRQRERMAMVGRTPDNPTGPVVVNNNNSTTNNNGGGGQRTRYRRGSLDGYSSWNDPVRGAS